MLVHKTRKFLGSLPEKEGWTQLRMNLNAILIRTAGLGESSKACPRITGPRGPERGIAQKTCMLCQSKKILKT